MKINKCEVKYSSIVEIGEMVSRLETETGDNYLKLHRGVMDVTTVNLDRAIKKIDFNSKKIQQYGHNDGNSNLISNIKELFKLGDHKMLITPGGMSTLDLVVSSLSDKNFYVPKYHWGSWNKILKTHDKDIKTFDDFNIEDVDIKDGVVMLCYPSNPTGFCPKKEHLEAFMYRCRDNGVTVILDLPYYYLFNKNDDSISDLFTENVIIASSFSKSIGLSGFRVGYIATKNSELYSSMKIRSLYKYNSISTIPQEIINYLLSTVDGKNSVSEYRIITKNSISRNIKYLSDKGLLFDEYVGVPIGPFAIIKKGFSELLESRISSVPLEKFTIDKNLHLEGLSRISVAVDHAIFIDYFEKMLNKNK